MFHAQQAIEKSIKGFLSWHDRTFRKTHNLVEIGESAAAMDSTLENLLRRAAPLTEYAWRFRYRGDPEEPPADEAREALSIAREVLEALLARLPSEVPLCQDSCRLRLPLPPTRHPRIGIASAGEPALWPLSFAIRDHQEVLVPLGAESGV